ncbi:glucosamine-6-phosphate deaminase [Fictibacillus fluitans]|uniref:Glucosamine-6-phosphate deaminase n=1 Tax=Fictibacillus fluitans TaxID=3058422 RepID=A0ABT8I0G2_9BACL|nr:glucosamine-6-phosphate deaminase [Fictibacillus sp. NE201]MDN4526495.1 glucosamine-6-phosphate deaminase [Fictibacillus sp. NE201]
MNIIEVANYEEMSKASADFILKKIKESEKVTLGLATGGTPLGTYQELVKDYKKNETSYNHVHTYNLDEYVGLTPDDPESYHAYMCEHLFHPVNMPLEQTNIPNGAAPELLQECLRYDMLIESIGGVDLQLLGIGENGHIGFNEPGTLFSTSTHVVDLTPSTLEANAKYFKDPSKQPSQAITMGIATILQSKEILLLASGERKQEALFHLLRGEVTESVPASALNMHNAVTIIADSQALKLVNSLGK